MPALLVLVCSNPYHPNQEEVYPNLTNEPSAYRRQPDRRRSAGFMDSQAEDPFSKSSTEATLLNHKVDEIDWVPNPPPRQGHDKEQCNACTHRISLHVRKLSCPKGYGQDGYEKNDYLVNDVG